MIRAYCLAICQPERVLQKVFLKNGREDPVLNGHPWIFSGAIQEGEEALQEAGVTDILDHQGRWLARGLYNPRSQIRVRVLTWQKEEIDRDFFLRRLSQAIRLRERHLSASTTAYRLINGEGDLLPGLVIDRYGDYLVCQFFTAGMDAYKGTVLEALSGLLSVKGIYEKSEGGVRDEEGLTPAAGVLWGESPPELISIEENQFKFLVDIRRGQKTGFFLDQRDNRLLLSTLAEGRFVLNCFAYTGAFSAYAMRGGAQEVISVESSRPALELARQNFELNQLAVPGEHLIKADVFSYLKGDDRDFDLIVLDPPSLAPRRADVRAAGGGYKFLNLHALRRLNRGGLLFTFCCSQHVSADLFQKIVFGAAVDAERNVQIVRKVGHPVDHPVSLHHPEGEYLKGLLLRVLD